MHVHTPSWFVLSSKATADINCGALVPCVLFTSLAFCIVGLRLYSRMNSGGLRIEDYLVALAMLLSIAITGAAGAEFGLDGGYIKSEKARVKVLSTMLKLVFAQSIFYHLAINLIKASFVFQYVRLFSHIRPIAYACYLLCLLIMGAASWGVFGVIFLCKPIDGYWNIRITSVCMNAEWHFWSSSIVGIVLDWALWLLPIPVVGRLNLPPRQKVGLLIVFGLGGFVCVVSILRLVLVHHFAHRGKVTKSGTYTLIWSSLEINVAIICASLLVMKPLFARFVPALVSEQPMSASEDAKLWRKVTGLHLLQGGAQDEEKAADGDPRRDTVIGGAANMRLGQIVARRPAHSSKMWRRRSC